MKKLKLKALELGAAELLTRNQLKNVLGGLMGSSDCTNACGGTLGNCPSGQECKSEICPNDPDFTHTVCVAVN